MIRFYELKGNGKKNVLVQSVTPLIEIANSRYYCFLHALEHALEIEVKESGATSQDIPELFS